MPLHHFFLDLPANTSNYLEDRLSVEAGEVSRVEVYWPLNTNRYVGVWFVSGEAQIIPVSGYLTGNGNIQNFELFERVINGTISMRGVNADIKFSHSIDAWINIIPEHKEVLHSGF